ncbi:MAG: GH1 family beta-glucosidase [Acidimicrobiales bacterium]
MTTFPDGFLFGAATSSFQIEGRSPSIPQGESIWDTFCAEPGRIADGSNGLVACDHVHRWAEDVELMRSLGLSTYRFSIAWPKVIPDGRGAVNEAGLDFYDRLVDGLLAAGIAPVPTLYHWDLPQGLQDRGGWVSRGTAEAFADYAQVVIEKLGDRVGTWMTLNEPYVSASHGYVSGEHAPGGTSLSDGLAAAHHLLLGHGLAMERIRSLAPHADAGIVLNFTPAEAATPAPADVDLTSVTNGWENEWYAQPVFHGSYPEATVDALGWSQSEVHDGDLAVIGAPIDLLGVNFYFRQVVSAVGQALPFDTPRTDMGWEIHAPSFDRLLHWLHDTHAPPKIVITENGCAMPDQQRVEGRVHDLDRIEYLHDHLAAVHRAIVGGVPVAGYLAWSLLDNFEWALGYEKRFGIVEVDFETLERTPKSSAIWFADLARTGTIPPIPDQSHEAVSPRP